MKDIYRRLSCQERVRVYDVLRGLPAQEEKFALKRSGGLRIVTHRTVKHQSVIGFRLSFPGVGATYFTFLSGDRPLSLGPWNDSRSLLSERTLGYIFI